MRKLLFILLIITAALALPCAVSADVVYDITVDTSTLNATSGNLDFTFGSGLDSLPAMVTIQNFDPLAGITLVTLSGDATFVYPDGTINNTPGYNDVYESFNFGNALKFRLDFSGPAISSPDPSKDGSTFAFSMFDSVGNAWGGDPLTGFAFTLDVNPDGTATTNNYSAFATITPVSGGGGQVPEPGSLCMIAFALSGIGLLPRKISN